jgi:hypothetical protein
VRNVSPKVPSGYRLQDLKTARDIWIGQYGRRISDDDEGMELQTFALEPWTGKPIEKYAYPKFFGLGLACADGREFSFLIRENNKLNLVKLLAKRQSGPANDSPDETAPQRPK